MSSLDCNQHMRDLCIYDSIFISIDFETVSIFEFFALSLQKSVQKRRPLQKNSGSFSILNKYDPMCILCRFTCGMNILMILTANFLIFFYFLFNSTLRSRSKVMAENRLAQESQIESSDQSAHVL